MSAGSKTNPLLDVTLHNGVATLPGTGGGDVSGWELPDDFMPRYAVLLFTNDGTDDLTLGDNTDPVTLLVDGVPVGVLFEGREMILEPGDTAAAFAPADSGSMGQTWSIRSAVASNDPVDVTVVARPIVTMDEVPPTVDEIADQVWDEDLSGHDAADSTGLALLLSKGLSQCNFVLDETAFDSAGMMTSGRIRIFPDAATAAAATQGGVGQGEIAEFLISASGATPGQLQLYKAVQQ
jgi:hypothetical protein